MNKNAELEAPALRRGSPEIVVFLRTLLEMHSFPDLFGEGDIKRVCDEFGLKPTPDLSLEFSLEHMLKVFAEVDFKLADVPLETASRKLDEVLKTLAAEGQLRVFSFRQP